jgi:arylsulfatase A-like enzyme
MKAKDTIKVAFTVFLTVIAILSACAQADIVQPSGINPATGAIWVNGDTYRIAFITSGIHDAVSTDIAVYNAFVQGLADAAGIGGEVDWFVIGSTVDVDARDNTSTNPEVETGCPVLLVDGSTVVANNNADLWDGEIAHIINLTEEGVEFTHWPFTGTNLDGTVTSGFHGPLGNTGTESSQGNSNSTTQWIWRTNTAAPKTELHYMYAMSEPLTVGGGDPNDPADPTVDSGDDMITWSDEPVTMTPTVVNNGGTPVEYAWAAETTDPNVVIVLNPNSGDPATSSDPNLTVTVTKIDSGGSVTVKVTLTVNNQGSTNYKSDFMLINVYDDACDAANAVAPVTFDSGDLNRDCITNLKDFAEMALTWLNDYTLSDLAEMALTWLNDFALSGPVAGTPLKPNILIIFTDDQGYRDFGCFGSPTNLTPRMDILASEGTKFTNFYAQTICGPSRSALLTGRNPSLSKGWGMPADEITWAELIKGAGYQTACIGKWDVSNRNAIISRMPNAQGFDYYFGALGANDNGSLAYHENNTPAGSTNDMATITRLYTDKAINYLENMRDENKPFVLYLAHTMMHTDIDASPGFLGTSAGGLYGDVVEEFDYETGRLLDTIDSLGLRNNTIVIYTTDNGPWNQPGYTENETGHPEGAIFWGYSGELRNGKGTCYEGGIRAPCIVRWPGRVAAGEESEAIFSTLDFLPTFASIAGFEVPDDRIIDGVDQLDLLTGDNPNGARDTFYYEHCNKQAVTEFNGVRKGKWKYLKAGHVVSNYADDDSIDHTEQLYDLQADIGETTNLAETYPDKLLELQTMLAEYIESRQ